MTLNSWLKDLENMANQVSAEKRPERKKRESKPKQKVSDHVITSLGRPAAPKSLGTKLAYSDEENRKIVRNKMAQFAPDHILTQVRALKCYWWRERDRADSLYEYAEKIALEEMEYHHGKSENDRSTKTEKGFTAGCEK